MTTLATRSALVALGLAALAAPHFAPSAFAQSTTVYVRPGYGFNGALQQTEAQTYSPYVVPGYTYVQPGYVVTTPAPTTTYTYVPPAYPAPASSSYPAPAPSVASAPILDRDTIEDRLDDQGYDDIKVGELHGTYYSVRAEDRHDRKLWLKVDATTGYVLESQYRRD